MEKQCETCFQVKDIDLFVKDKNKKDGVRNRCKACQNLKIRKTPIPPTPKDGFKFCAKCKEEKPLNEYNIRFVFGKYRPFSYCIPCERNEDNNRYAHTCAMCGKQYKSGKKVTTYCKDCHSTHLIKTYSLLHTLDLRGEKNPMFGRQRFGIENPNFKPEKTEEERELGRLIEGYGVWRKAVYERDNYICQCCGYSKGGNLHAHHLDGYSWCVEKRTDVDNGVTLCETCHKEFHSVYGNFKNTKQQFISFMETKKKDTLP